MMIFGINSIYIFKIFYAFNSNFTYSLITEIYVCDPDNNKMQMYEE